MKMDYFKTDISTKEFKTLTEEILPVMSKCGLCGNFSYKWHKEFLLTCSQCRDVRCSNCVMLKYSISLLMKLAEDDARDYLRNFITDYFNLSDIGLKNFFNIQKSNETNERIKTFDLKVYHKSKKNRSQVLMKTLENCKKFNIFLREGNVIFIKKIDFLYF